MKDTIRYLHIALLSKLDDDLTTMRVSFNTKAKEKSLAPTDYEMYYFVRAEVLYDTLNSALSMNDEALRDLLPWPSEEKYLSLLSMDKLAERIGDLSDFDFTHATEFSAVNTLNADLRYHGEKVPGPTEVCEEG